MHFDPLIEVVNISLILMVSRLYFDLLRVPSRPESTRYLNVKEREIALECMNRDVRSDVGVIIKKGELPLLSSESAQGLSAISEHISALLDWRIYIDGMIYFWANCVLLAF